MLLRGLKKANGLLSKSSWGLARRDSVVLDFPKCFFTMRLALETTMDEEQCDSVLTNVSDNDEKDFLNVIWVVLKVSF